MRMRIFHTVNAALYLWNGKSGLLIDALHRGREYGFSDTPERYVRMLERGEGFFSQAGDILLTHTHPDHYDAELVEEFLRRHPDSAIYAPGLDRSSLKPVILETGVFLLRIRKYEIFAFSTVHDGAGFEHCPHCSYLIRWNGQSLWVSGDALLEPALAEKVRRRNGGKGPDAAFAMVYQVGRTQGERFLRALEPGKLWLYHLPYQEDDVYGYRRMAEDIVARCTRRGLEVRILPEDSCEEL